MARSAIASTDMVTVTTMIAVTTVTTATADAIIVHVAASIGTSTAKQAAAPAPRAASAGIAGSSTRRPGRFPGRPNAYGRCQAVEPISPNRKSEPS